MSKNKTLEIRRSTQNARLAIRDIVNYHIRELENLEKSQRTPYTKAINPKSMSERIAGLRAILDELDMSQTVIIDEIQKIEGGL